MYKSELSHFIFQIVASIYAGRILVTFLKKMLPPLSLVYPLLLRNFAKFLHSLIQHVIFLAPAINIGISEPREDTKKWYCY